MKKYLAACATLMLVVSALGCAGSPSRSNKPSTPTPTSPTQTSPTSPTLPPVEDSELAALLETTVSFEQGDFAALESRLETVTATYPYEELYGIVEAYAWYKTLPSYTSKHENLFADGVFTADELYTIVKANNQKNNYPPVKQITDADLRDICEVMAPMLEEYGTAMSEADAALLSEKISELKVYIFTEFSNGAYDSLTSELGMNISYKNTDQYARTIQHETHHMIQSSSMAENQARGFDRRIGFGYVNDEDGENPLLLNWIVEGAAEAMTHHRLGSIDYDVYEDYIKFMDAITAAYVLREDVGPESLERLTLTDDWDTVFAYFDAETETERREILNMLEAINFRFDPQNCSEDFERRYEETYGTSLSMGNDFRYAAEQAFGITLMREFFENYIAVLEGKTVTVNELFTMNALFEYRLTDLLMVGGAGKCAEMVRLYAELQTMMFDVMSAKADVSTDDICRMYETFFEDSVLQASTVSFLSDDEAAFLQYTADTARNARFRSLQGFNRQLG